MTTKPLVVLDIGSTKVACAVGRSTNLLRHSRSSEDSAAAVGRSTHWSTGAGADARTRAMTSSV